METTIGRLDGLPGSLLRFARIPWLDSESPEL